MAVLSNCTTRGNFGRRAPCATTEASTVRGCVFGAAMDCSNVFQNSLKVPHPDAEDGARPLRIKGEVFGPVPGAFAPPCRKKTGLGEASRKDAN
jgi:hypothetical protein